MDLKQFTLGNLSDLDGGKAAIAFEHHVRRAAIDCSDRPGDPTARKITFEVTIEPVMQPGGDCSDVDVRITVKSTIPPHKTKPYSMGLRRNGVVVFNPDSPDAIDQATFLSSEDDAR